MLPVQPASLFPSPLPATLIDLLLRRAADSAHKRAFTFLRDGEEEARSLTFGELCQAAQSIAARLQQMTRPGERALLLFPPGLDQLEAFLGAVCAGLVPVPTLPPTSRRTLPRLKAIAADAEVSVVLGESGTLERFRRQSEAVEELTGCKWLATDEVSIELAAHWRSPSVAREDPALLQYTSGSTAAPKGVVVTHSNLIHNEVLIRNAFSQDADSVIVGWLPAQHDMGLIGNILQPLYASASCILMSPTAFLQRPRRWLEAISRYRATTSGGPNFAYDLCVKKIPPGEREGLDLSSWRVAFNGAEPVRPQTLERFTEAFAPWGFERRALLPCYGLAEATLFVSGTSPDAEPRVCSFSAAALEQHRAEPSQEGEGARSLVGCGAPRPGQEVRIVHPETAVCCLPGEVGEIWVEGPSVAAGYWGLAGGGEDFQGRLADGSGPFLRTGDLGFLHDGELFIAGRRKDLIILRGRNHWPQDLELTAETSHSALLAGASAAFTVPTESEEGERLVLVVEVGRRIKASFEAVSEAVREAVAQEHGTEVSTVVLLPPAHLSKTSSGKVQRRAIRRAYLAGVLPLLFESSCGEERNSAEGFVAPRDATEVRLAGIWSDLFDGRAVGVRDSFFHLGGDSVVAAQLTARVRSAFEVEMSIEKVFEASTVEEQARWLELAQKGNVPLPLGRASVASEGEPSFGQERLWFHSQLEPLSPAYNLPLALRLRGQLARRALATAWQTVVHRHSPLRSRIVKVDGRPRVVVDSPAPVALPMVDLSTLSRDSRRSQSEALVRREGLIPFDLAKGPLARAALLDVGDGEHLLLIDLHHSSADGWSLVVLVREISTLYNDSLARGIHRLGRKLGLAPLPLSYADFVAWQRQRHQGETGRRDLDFWCQRLADAPGSLELPADGRRYHRSRFRGGRITRALEAENETAVALRRLAQERSATLFMVLLATFLVLLYRLTGSSDLAVGVPVASRPRGPLEKLVGLFLNTLVLRTEVVGELTFNELLGRVRETCLEAYDHQETPFERIVEALGLSRDPSRNPLFQVFFNMLNFPREGFEFDGVTAELVDSPEPASKFDLTVYVDTSGGGLRVDFLYDADLFSARRAEEMTEQYLLLLDQVAARPARRIELYGLCTPAAAATLPDPALPLPERWKDSLGTALARAAELHGDRLALVEGNRRWRHDELAALGYRLAHDLLAADVGRGRRLVLFAERSAALVWGLLGAVHASAPFTVLDPSLPVEQVLERLTWLLGHGGLAGWLELGAETPSAVRAVLEREGVSYREGWRSLSEAAADPRLAALPTTPPALPVAAGDPAYIAFTSGTSGAPHAIVGPQRALSHFFEVYGRTFGIHPDDRFSLLSGLGHDPLLRDVFAPLWHGATICVPPPAGLRFPRRLRDWLNRLEVTIAHLTPAMIRLITRGAGIGRLPMLRYAFSGGALLTEREVKTLARVAPNATCVNVYGATETPQIHGYQVAEIPAAVERSPQPIPLGRGLEGSQLLVTNAAGEPAGIGELGEIRVRSPYLALGYLGKPEQTAQRFLDGVVYRTGDRGRYEADGTVSFAGRIDDQVEVRGFRVELRAVEEVLLDHPQVDRAAVVPNLRPDGESELVAYLEVAGGDSAPAVSELVLILRARLASSHLPSAFLMVEGGLPLTANGKVDRRHLASASVRELPSGRDYVAPANDLEAGLCALWEENLGRGRIGVDDNFFELGGSSLTAVQLVSEMERCFEVELAVVDLFDRPTIRSLAEQLQWLLEAGDLEAGSSLARPGEIASVSALADRQSRGGRRRQFAARRRRVGG